MAAFLEESRTNGWLSFRDEELVVENLRSVRGSRGEIVSADGLHVGINNPDEVNTYVVNLVSIAGHPPRVEKAKDEL